MTPPRTTVPPPIPATAHTPVHDVITPAAKSISEVHQRAAMPPLSIHDFICPRLKSLYDCFVSIQLLQPGAIFLATSPVFSHPDCRLSSS